MRRLFLRLYIGIALTVLGLLGGSLYIQHQDLEAADTLRFESMVTPLLERARLRAELHHTRLQRDGEHPNLGRRPGPRGAEGVRGPGEDGHPRSGRARQEMERRGWDMLTDAWGVQLLERDSSALGFTPAQSAQLRQGRLVTLRTPRGERYAYADLRPDTVIEAGPFPPAAGTPALKRAAVRLVVATLAFGLVLFLLLRPVERRLRAIKRASSEFGAGAYDTRVVDSSPDEIGAVAESFNAMAQQVQFAIEQRRELLQSVSHELRTPLGRLAFRIEELALAETEHDRERQRLAAERSIAELDALVDELLRYARLDAEWGANPSERVNVGDVVTACLARESDARLGALPLAEELIVIGSSALLERALGNLLHNALRYADTRVEVRAERHHECVHLIVDDDGPGVPADAGQRIFEPFTQRDAARGERGAAGLGLAIVARSAERHGGRAFVADSPLGGCRAVIEVPLAAR
ncbi:MAG: two-component system sensor histidine kinase RstB [Bradymonadia bacterium]|jgi:two-component system sensor histidine kinase RstB